MAKQVWNNPIDKHTDWGGDPVKTDGLPVSGEMVQKFIKDALEGKAGLFWYDATNNRYLVFADADARDEYLADPNKTELIIGTFDAPFNYTAEISLNSSAYNAVFLGSAGNYIDFTFDIKNKQGASTGENVTVTYTFIRNATRQEVKETRKYGDAVRFNVDKYLGEGTNTVIVGIVGQTSLAATTVAITYQVVNLVLTDKYDISKSYNLSSGAKKVEVPFTVSGYGTKIVEWYLDGELLPFVKSEDEVVDVIATRTKYIEIANLQQGTHSLQFRAYTVVNGEQFYTDTLYRDIMVYTGANSNVILGVAVTIPRQYGILGANDRVSIYDMIQFVPYTLRFATYSPSNAANTEVVVSLDGKEMGRVGSVNNVENRFVITPSTSGTKTLKLSAPGETKEYQAVIKETDMDIAEIDSGLVLNFTAEGKTYNSPDRDYWTDGVHNAVLSGFNWNATSGWWNGRLEMSAGSSIQFDYAPLSGNPTNTGKTIEIEWSTKNVTNDDAVICDLRGDDGVGILITATKVSMKSADGVVVETEYKSDENVRIGFVINQTSGTTNQRLSFIYANGIVSRGEKWAQADSYTSDKLMKFTATEEAEVSLKSIRIYDTALTSDNMLNNYILYRDTIAEMMEVYDRNDVYEEGTKTFSPDKMMGRLPVMIVTGDIPILENTSDKDTQIVVDIDYYNMQDTSKSFRMTGAAMRPQGTSSMGYPKKNFRIYTQEVDGTILYDAEGKVVENKLYSFKEGAQPVNCWCLKADYAESSGTHNTGIARLWNTALHDARVSFSFGKDDPRNIDNAPVLRTQAQQIAIDAHYEYDVRTTIDGFPILLFYRKNPTDDVIFIGKYNFNNDKSTESVFGFTGIPGFNNEKMQCWEVLNNGNALALFTTTEGFDTGWSKAFESRYPNTKTPYTGDLKAFCQWMVNVSQADFATEKWQHLNVYMMAAYWCYLMRHAAADQFVKNAMFTSEDGVLWYFILYDNDTINGLINTGHLEIQPTDDRQTMNKSGEYVFAGHDSRLWNMLEADNEFKEIVSAVDNALYSAGISYANTIKIFDEEQADKWVERVYNQDAQYKYVGPYVEKGIDNLFMLQGKRDLHRRWWLAKRFSIYDAKYVSGTYKSQAVELKCINDTPAGQTFTIKAGYPLDYGYGINNVPREFGVPLAVGESKEFTTREVVFRGDPIRIYGAPNIAEIDLSKMSAILAVITIANVYDEALGTKLTKLVVGNPNTYNYEVAEISGLKQAEVLEYLDIQGMAKMTSLDLSNHQYFKTLKAKGSGISSVSFAKGAPVERLELPATLRVLSLTQLPHLASDNVVLENIANLQSISILACPNLSDDFDFVYDWIDSKTTDDRYCSLVMDGVDWHLSNADKFMRLLALKTNGGTFSIKGKVRMDSIKVEQIYAIRDILGESSFDPNAEFYVDIPSVLQINAEDSVLEGNNLQFTTSIYPYLDGQYTWSLESGRSGCSIDQNGLLITEETALDTSDVVVKVTFVANDGEVLTATKTVSVVRRTYPQNIVINGASDPRESAEYTWSHNTEGVNGEYSVVWSLEGSMTSYWRIASSDSQRCVLEKTGAMPNSVSGTVKASIVREFDKGVASVGSLTLSLPVVFPANATIIGNVNPLEKPYTYTWETTTEGINGEFYARWSLNGAVTSAVKIASQDDEKCVMEVLDAPTEIVSGQLTLTLYNRVNDSVILAASKHLEAVMEGVVITSKTNPIIQAALYSNGLVANEKYSLKKEVELINSTQLLNALYNLSSTDKSKITQFNELQYFTGLTAISGRTFERFDNLVSITLPDSITTIGGSAFAYCSKLPSITIPKNVNTIGEKAFASCSKLTKVYISDLSAWCKIAIGSYLTSSPASNGAGLYLNGELITDLVIPNDISEIKQHAFYGVSQLENVTLHEGVTKIGDSAFSRCTGKLTINGDIATSSLYTMKGNKFTSVVFGDNVTRISYRIMYNSPNLQSITIGRGVKSISGEAFDCCPNVNTIYSLPVQAPSLGDNVFGSSGFTGSNNSANGTNRLYVQTLAAGYDSGQWIDPLCNPDKCGFTIYGKLTLASNKPDVEFRVSYTTIEGNLKLVDVGVGTCYLSDIKYGTELTATPIPLGDYVFDSASTTITYNGETTITNNAYIYPKSVVINGPSSIMGGKNATFVASVSPSDADGIYTWSIEGSTNASISSTNGSTCVITTGEASEEETFSLTCVFTSLDNTVVVSDTYVVAIEKKQNVITAIYNVTSTTSTTKLFYSSFGITGVTYMEIDGVEVTPTKTYQFTSTGLHTIKFTPSTALTYCFYTCSQLVSVDFSSFDGSNIGAMSYLFHSCRALTSIEWGKCVFPQIKSLNYAFKNCSALTTIDLSPFQNAPITNISYAFEGCTSLVSIDLSPLSGTNVTNLTNFLSGCTSLKTIIVPWETAPTLKGKEFGSEESTYTGRNTYNTGQNLLLVPSGATGYGSGYWLDPLQSASKCGFTLSATL